jgi:hypothetical protein
MATKEMKRAKAHKLLSNADPRLNQFDYNSSVMLATNYFNVNYDHKQRMSWLHAHYPKTKWRDLPDLEFKSLSSLVRLVDNGNELSDKHIALMASEVERLTDRSKQVKVATKDVVATLTPKATIQDKMDDKVSEFLGEFAGLVDQYTIDRTIPKVDLLVRSMGIRGPMVKKVLSRVANTIAELEEAIEGTDDQLKEGYSHFKKVELKRLLGIYTSLTECMQQAKVATVRKTRTVKVKPPAVIAKSVKYQVENLDLKMKSISPASVVGMSELWVFNTKYRTLQYYEATTGSTLTFKGTSILNFDVTKSVGKTIRKPEMMNYTDGKRVLNKFFKETKAAEKKVNGRLNAECILLVTYK